MQFTGTRSFLQDTSARRRAEPLDIYDHGGNAANASEQITTCIQKSRHPHPGNTRVFRRLHGHRELVLPAVFVTPTAAADNYCDQTKGGSCSSAHVIPGETASGFLGRSIWPGSSEVLRCSSSGARSPGVLTLCLNIPGPNIYQWFLCSMQILQQMYCQ